MFCIKPAIASISTCVRPSYGVVGTIGSKSICVWVNEEEGVVNALFKTEEITDAPKIKIRPKIAFRIVDFACSICSGLPEDVMYS